MEGGGHGCLWREACLVQHGLGGRGRHAGQQVVRLRQRAGQGTWATCTDIAVCMRQQSYLGPSQKDSRNLTRYEKPAHVAPDAHQTQSVSFALMRTPSNPSKGLCERTSIIRNEHPPGTEGGGGRFGYFWDVYAAAFAVSAGNVACSLQHRHHGVDETWGTLISQDNAHQLCKPALWLECFGRASAQPYHCLAAPALQRDACCLENQAEE